MFQHAYNGYLKYANGYDELRPLSCDGINTWGSYSLTLIDALDTLAVMGNYTEFRRVVNILTEKSNFDADINVSVFETNIRIVGGLLSAHLMSKKAGLEVEDGWPCKGALLRLAEDVAKRLLPAFDTKTGMPYGTVNLRYGVPFKETSVTCTAGVGTFIVEFGTLSRLTGNPIYEEVALNALYSLWNHKSSIGLFGNHIDVETGRWTAQDSGIGAGVDSFYEYLVKGSILLNRPELLELFEEGRKAIDKYLRKDDWHVWVSMSKGQVTLPVFQSLEAYWPGVLSLVGETSLAMRTLHNYHSVWKQYGFLPEFYNIPNGEASANRENYPLRPELIESVMYLYRATHDPYLLEVGEDILRSIQYSAKTSCGYATIKNVRDHRKEDRMESFFLAETTKYLYLLFDENNFLHNEGGEGTILQSSQGECVIDSGGYIFNTEAHPIDPSALECCHRSTKKEDFFENFNYEDFIGESLKIKEFNKNKIETKSKCNSEENFEYLSTNSKEKKVSSKESARKIAMEIINNFDKIEIEFENKGKLKDVLNENNLPTFSKDKTKINFHEKEMFNKDENVNTANYKLNKYVNFSEDDYLRSNLITIKKSMFKKDPLLQTLQTVIISQLTYYNITRNTENETISTSDFWENLNSSETLSDLLDRYKHNAKFENYVYIVEELLNLKETYLKKFSNNISVEYLLTKTLELLETKDIIKLENNIDTEIYNILLKAQKNYDIYVNNKTVDVRLYQFIYHLQNAEHSQILPNIVKRVRQADTIKNEISKKDYNIITEEAFEVVKEMLYLQINLFKKIKKLSKENNELISSPTELSNNISSDKLINISRKTVPTTVEIKTKTVKDFSNKISDNNNSNVQNVDDDIIIANENEEESDENELVKNLNLNDEKETGIGSVEVINIESTSLPEDISDNEEIIEKTINLKNDNREISLSAEQDKTNNKNFAITELIDSILKTTMAKSKIFNYDEFLEKVRNSGLYLNKTQNFDLFYCKAQPFLNRFSLRGQFFDD